MYLERFPYKEEVIGLYVNSEKSNTNGIEINAKEI